MDAARRGPHHDRRRARRVQCVEAVRGGHSEAVDIGALVASPTWRRLATGDAEQQQRFITEIGLRLGRPDYKPPQGGDAIAHWMKFDSSQLPSKPHKLFPDTREHGSIRQVVPSPQSNARQDRSAFWFRVNRRGGSVLLHHHHIRPVLIRDWSPPMDGIAATIWQSQTTVTGCRGVPLAYLNRRQVIAPSWLIARRASILDRSPSLRPGSLKRCWSP